MSTNYEALILKCVEEYDSKPDLLWGQLDHESGFNPNAQGPNRDAEGRLLSMDRGIAQINSVAHPEVSDQEAYDPNFAIPWMAKKMKAFFDEYHDWEKAFIAYNAGHYGPDTAWDVAYPNAVFALARTSPFKDNVHAYFHITSAPKARKPAKTTK